MSPTTFADFVIVALAVPCIVLVLSGYVLLAAALFGNLRGRYVPDTATVTQHVPVKG